MPNICNCNANLYILHNILCIKYFGSGLGTEGQFEPDLTFSGKG